MPTATSASPRNPGPVLHLVASAGLYGIERMLLSLLPALRSRSCETVLACLGCIGAQAALAEALSGSGVPVRHVEWDRRFSPRGLLRLHGLLAELRPRLLHVHGYKATILGGPLGVAKRIPTVATFHTEASKTEGLSRYIRVESAVLRRLDAVAAVSEPIRQELEARGVSASRIQVIPNGIPDPDGARRLDATSRRSGQDGPVVFAAGRLIEKKNFHLLIDAVAGLRERFPRIRLRLAGDGPFRAELEARVRTRGLQDCVQLPGFLDDIQGHLRGCDCFALPSQTEGMPISLLEAMSCGAPIVASAVGSIPEVARHESEAILVPPGDLPALQRALRRVLEDLELRRRLAAASRKRFLEEYTAGCMAEKYVAFYEAILKARPTAPRD